MKKITENHVYIAVFTSIQVDLTAERCPFGKAESKKCNRAYFAFNMAYHKVLYPLGIFIQHFVLNKQKVRDIVIKGL